MKLCDNFVEAIGNTPLIRLNGPSEQTGCNIYGKAEFANPGGSVKDRAAWQIVSDALEQELIQAGATLVEGTAGNTGIGLTLVANSLGMRCIVVMPETQSEEKRNTLRAIGADLRLVPAVPYKDQGNYVHVSRRIAEEFNAARPRSALWANQFDNTSNRKAHYTTTGPEINRQLSGNVHGFICAVGTGGTLAGVAASLREYSPDVAIGIADPMGSALYGHYANGELKAEGSSVTEGIGQGRITANLEGLQVDYACQIDDAEAMQVLFDLVISDGLFLGGSSGINVAGAMHLARRLGPGHNIVTILCDSGTRYQSKLFNPQFLREKGMQVPEWMHA